MPCNSDGFDPSRQTIELSRVACLLDELDGKPLDRDHWRGYHPAVYNMCIQKPAADAMVAELCSRLQNVDVKQYSLELQMWWRDHQAADQKRLQHEMARKKTDEDRAFAIAKLTPYERELLGIQPS